MSSPLLLTRAARGAPPTATGFSEDSDSESQEICIIQSPPTILRMRQEPPNGPPLFEMLPRVLAGWATQPNPHPAGPLIGAQDVCEVHNMLRPDCRECEKDRIDALFGQGAYEETVPETPKKRAREFTYPGAVRRVPASPTVILASEAEEEPTLYEIALEERCKKLKREIGDLKKQRTSQRESALMWRGIARKADGDVFGAQKRIDSLEAELAKVNGQYERLADATAELIKSLTTKLKADGACHRALQSTIEQIHIHHL